MKNCKKIVCILLGIVTVSLSSVTAFALTQPDSFYDSIAWTWEYSGPATSSYNCLGYATGSMTWEWAWGASNPSSSKVTTYLKNKGYSTSGNWAQIVSYGTSSAVTHFSKVTGTSWCRAKWGSLERFNHASWDPYYSNSVYGSKVKVYYQ